MVPYDLGPGRLASIGAKVGELLHQGAALVRRGYAELTQGGETSEEYNVPYLKLPNGVGSENPHQYWLDKENEATEAELGAFFEEHPDALDRVIICPKINIDSLDDWGMFGHEPGYLFIVGKSYREKRVIADEIAISLLAENPVHTESGRVVPTVPDYASWAHGKYHTQLVTAGRAPRTFAVISELLGPIIPPPLAIES